MIRKIHHLDFVVRDLDSAVAHWSRLLDREPVAREELPERGVRLARFDVGGTWLILVQPVAESSPVRRFLESEGEGFFHVAFEVDDLEAEAQRLIRQDLAPDSALRKGVEGWRLFDVPAEHNLGAMAQLVAEAEP